MKNKKMDIINDMEFASLYQKSKKLIDNARSNMGQMANIITVITSFLLGHYIVEQEQQGQERAKYGSKVIDSLSSYLTSEYGRGFSRSYPIANWRIGTGNRNCLIRNWTIGHSIF